MKNGMPLVSRLVLGVSESSNAVSRCYIYGMIVKVWQIPEIQSKVKSLIIWAIFQCDYNTRLHYKSYA